MNLLPPHPSGCPYLFLAPMEGVADPAFRKALASIGGFDEAVTEFIRVPQNAHVVSLAKVYQAGELGSIPLAAQVMGSDPVGIAAMGLELEKRGAKRIDLNCGCPSNTVVGKGAGSSLLKTPETLYHIAKTLVRAVQVPVTVKMRSGYEDTSLLKENLLAAQESGIAFLTLHPRTKVDGYGPPARWEHIAYAKSILSIPVVGNGDIISAAAAHAMLKQTGCDAFMVGRAAVTNPFIFQEIKASFEGKKYTLSWQAFEHFLDLFVSHLSKEVPLKNQINKMKQLFSFLFKKTEALLEAKSLVLTQKPSDLHAFVEFAKQLLKKHGNFDI